MAAATSLIHVKTGPSTNTPNIQMILSFFSMKDFLIIYNYLYIYICVVVILLLHTKQYSANIIFIRTRKPGNWPDSLDCDTCCAVAVWNGISNIRCTPVFAVFQICSIWGIWYHGLI